LTLDQAVIVDQMEFGGQGYGKTRETAVLRRDFTMTDPDGDWVGALGVALSTTPNYEERSPVERAKEARERADAARRGLVAARNAMMNAAGLVGGPASVDWEEAQRAIVAAERAVVRAMQAV
jgi:hypothetical protein